MRNKYLHIKHQNITDYLEEHYPHDLDKILLADGFEAAFLGVVESFGTVPKACYNYDTCIAVLMERPDHLGIQNSAMTREEAEEYLTYNVTQAYVGEHTPAFIKGLNSWMEDLD